MNKRFDSISRKIYQDVTHVFDLVPPHLILAKIFQPYLWVTRLVGILPIQISKQAGSASCKLVSWASCYTGLACATFIFDSSLLLPMYLFLVRLSSGGGGSSTGGQKVTHIAQMMFVSCQYLGAALTYVISILNAPNFVQCWNRTQTLVGKVAVLSSTSNRDFLSVYLGARWSIKMWVVCSVSFSLFCVYRSVRQYIFPNYKGNLTLTNWNQLRFWI